jgi:hypothetical protein
VKLHQVWDTSLIDFARGQTPLDTYAGKLNQRITDKNQTDWEADMGPASWAKESHQLAKKYAYPPVIDQKWDDHKNDPVNLDIDYAKNAMPVVEAQLMKAGVRLAKILNEALAQ